MRLKMKFFGTPIAFDGELPGDLVFADSHDHMLLVLVVGTIEQKQYLVLRRWPEREGMRHPHPIAADALRNRAIRRVDDELLLVRPGADDADAFVPTGAYPMHTEHTNLIAYGEGNWAMLVSEQRGSNYWDMRTGANVEIVEGDLTQVVTHWQLVWVDGDDKLTLCEFNVPTR